MAESSRKDKGKAKQKESKPTLRQPTNPFPLKSILKLGNNTSSSNPKKVSFILPLTESTPMAIKKKRLPKNSRSSRYSSPSPSLKIGSTSYSTIPAAYTASSSTAPETSATPSSSTAPATSATRSSSTATPSSAPASSSTAPVTSATPSSSTAPVTSASASSSTAPVSSATPSSSTAMPSSAPPSSSTAPGSSAPSSSTAQATSATPSSSTAAPSAPASSSTATPSSAPASPSTAPVLSAPSSSTAQAKPKKDSESPLSKFWYLHDLYEIKNVIGTAGRFTPVYAAEHTPNKALNPNLELESFPVAMKVFQITQEKREKWKEAMHSVNVNILNLRNVVRVERYFESQKHLCIVIPCSDLVSIRTLVPDNGYPEHIIKIILRETLIALVSIHTIHGHMHRELNAGCVFFRHNIGAIQVSYAATLCDHPSPPVASFSGYSLMNNITKWGRAPEVVDSQRRGQRYEGYTQKSDMWNLGLMALELGYGSIQAAGRAGLMELLAGLRSKSRLPDSIWVEGDDSDDDGKEKKKGIKLFFKKLKGLAKKKEKRFSKSFTEMVLMCLAETQSERPTAAALLNHQFFVDAGNISIFQQTIVTNRTPAQG